MDAVCFYTAFEVRLNELCQGEIEMAHFKMLTAGRTDSGVPLKKTFTIHEFSIFWPKLTNISKTQNMSILENRDFWWSKAWIRL